MSTRKRAWDLLISGQDSRQRLGDRLGPAVTMATTEHFNLQTARAATISEANGRANIYLAAVSSNLIALAFVGQISRLGTAFYAFSLVLLPVLAFVGVVTFQHLVQASLEDIAYRKLSQGSRSERGAPATERLLSAAISRRLRGRSLFAYLVEVAQASIRGQPAPTLA
jgi:hypothetical protein